jgi:hypothetical protein
MGDGVGEKFLFLDEPGVGAMFVNVHRATHDDETVDRIQIGRGGTGEPLSDGQGVAAFAGPTGDFRRAFKGNVLENVEAHERRFLTGLTEFTELRREFLVFLYK